MMTVFYRCKDCGERFSIRVSMKRGQRKQPCPKCKSRETTYAGEGKVML